MQTVNLAFGDYRFDLAAAAIYEFTWNEYCDWYLEFSKPVLTADAPADAKQATRHTLVHVLETLLRLAHPIIPFITEEIWQRLAPLAGDTAPTLMQKDYPHYDANQVDPTVETEMRWIMDFILGVRNIRGEMNLSPAKPLSVLLQYGGEQDRQRVTQHQVFLRTLARLSAIHWLSNEEKAPPAAAALIGGVHLFIPMAGLIDIAAEQKRLDKEIERLRKDLDRTCAKLDNPSFIDRAPAEIVTQERARFRQMGEALAKLEAQRNIIAQLSE